MQKFLKYSLAASALALAAQASAQVTFYQNENYKGATFSTAKPISNFQ